MKNLLLFLFMAFSLCNLTAGSLISSESERIIDSQPYPVAKTAAVRWQNKYPELTKVLQGGQDGAQVTLLYNEDRGELVKDFFPYIYGKHPQLRVITLPLALPPETFNKFNQISCLVYPDMPDRASVWFEVGGSGIWTQACFPLKPRQWNRISICWSNHTPEQARKIKNLLFSRVNSGRLPQDPQWSKYYVKDIVLENVAVGTEYTWETSPEKIVVSQTGYAPEYTKRAILNGNHGSDTFTVVDGNGKSVFNGELQTREFPTGRFRIADFSALQTPGTYTVRSGNLESVPFVIGNDHLNNLAEKNVHFLYCMRSGMATPAHPECFMDDCIRGDNGQPVDLSGGWFDASDLRGYHSMAMKTILRPLALASAFYNTAPSLYDESLWGAKMLNKLFDSETGLPFTVHELYPGNNPDPRLAGVLKSGHFLKVNNYWTDNISGSGDERTIHLGKTSFICHPDLLDSHWGLTAAGFYFYLTAREEDRGLADSVLTKSKRHFDFICDSSTEELKQNGIGNFTQSSPIAMALRLENAVALWQATRKTYYRELAFNLARTIISRQKRELFRNADGYFTGYFCSSKKFDYSEYHRDDMTIYALTALAREFPESPIFTEIQSALRIYADFYLKNPAAAAQPYTMPYMVLTEKPAEDTFNALLATSLDGKKQIFGRLSTYFASGVIGTYAFQHNALAVFLNEPELQEKAAASLTFMTGENQYGRSFVADAGANGKKDIMSSPLGWISGMMSNPQIVKGIPSLPYHRHYGTNEIYTQTQAGYAATVCVLNAPAKITFDIANAAPGTELVISGLRDGSRIVRKVVNGRNEVEIPGGNKCRVRIGSLEFTEKFLRGEVRTIPVDLKAFCRITDIRMPAEVKSDKDFTIQVDVQLYSNGSTGKAVLEFAGDNLTCSREYAEVEMPAVPGTSVTTTVQLTGKCTAAGYPFVFMVYPADDCAALRSASGAAL